MSRRESGGPAVAWEGLAPTDPRALRDVVLVGHSGAGKTALAEALLLAAGAVSRAGRLADGTTVCDSDPVEVAGKRSVGLALAAFTHADVKVNLLDAPGYPDFVGELRAGLRAADAALFVVNATQGIDAVTAALWEECASAGTPRAVVVTGLDSPRADFEQMVEICARVLGDGGEVVPASLPLLADDGSVAGLLDLLRRRVVDVSSGSRVERDPDPEHLSLVAEARGTLIEAVIAESEDETLLDRYLGGEEIDVDVLVADLESAVAKGRFHPVLPVSAPSAAAPCGVGVEEVLDLIVRGFPCPVEREPLAVTRPDGRPVDPVTCDPDGPLVAEVIRTTTDPYVGRLSLLRVFSGTLRPEMPLHVSGHVSGRVPAELAAWHPDHDSDEKAGALASPLGAKLRPVGHAVAGDLVTVARLAGAETGDTVSSPDRPLLVAPWALPEPWLPVALTVPGGEEEKLASACARLVAEDATLRLERSPTGQLLLWCVGEAQAQVALTRLAERHGLAVSTEPVRLPLTETVSGTGTGTGRLVKQSGGHGQYAVLTVEVEPLPSGSGLQFDSRITGGAVPATYLAAAERGIRTRAARGLHDGWPLVDVKITALDGKTHSVDSSDQAFATAGAMALEEACTAAGRVLLEPVLDVEVQVPSGHLGAVLADLATRRARVTGTDPSPDGGPTVIRAEVPEAEALRYSAALRSLTHGTATFSRRPLRYEPVPPQARERVLAGV